ncbi:MAG: hypothetical protein H6697_02755 [Myxococcales bacterium]|nr:hypothetical protein [Myxococcales bacterium]
MRRVGVAVMSAVLAAAVAVPAAAEPGSRGWAPSAGLRIGGYGFRDSSGGSLSWDECRMNGVGALVRLEREAPWYLQLSVDGYHATGPTVDGGMDRLSLTPAAAIGASLRNRTPLLPHIELGVGAEATSVEIGDASARRVLPMAYIGAGVEVVVGDFALGTTIRSSAMGLPDHEEGASASKAAGESDGAGDEAVVFHAEVAGQVTFSLRYQF